MDGNTHLRLQKGNPVGIRMDGGGIAISQSLPLTVDYEKETATDLWGNSWDIDVADTQATWREPE